MNQKILWLDVAVTNSQKVNVRECPTQLIEIELDVKQRERRGMFLMPSTNRVNSFGNKLEN